MSLITCLFRLVKRVVEVLGLGPRGLGTDEWWWCAVKSSAASDVLTETVMRREIAFTLLSKSITPPDIVPKWAIHSIRELGSGLVAVRYVGFGDDPLYAWVIESNQRSLNTSPK
jgi:hypothetical protein